MTWLISIAYAVGTLVAVVLFVFLLEWLIHKTDTTIVILIIVCIAMTTVMWHISLFG